jgi:hypothetical protein
MTAARLNGVILILWLLLAALILSIAFNAAHFSPWEFVIPTGGPVTWISPTLLFGPPLFLLITRAGRFKVPPAFSWVVAAILALVIVAIFVVFSPCAYLGS